MEMLGKYGLLEKLGDEYQGPVYKAYDSSSHQNVILVTLSPEFAKEPALKERFIGECAAVLRMKHPNLATVCEQGEDRNIAFLSAQLILGKDLRQFISENVVTTLEWKIGSMLQVAAGLVHAHTHGVLHRNLCPGDIFILQDGTARVSGFGRGALAPAPGTAQQLTAASIYRAPEQLRGQEATAQSDVFSLGLIFYEFVTGVHPFHDVDSNKVIEFILHQDQFPTVEQFPDLPFNLWPILERCLAKEAEERYQSMRDFAAACQGVLEELAEDSECMRIELQTALPRLRRAAKRKDALPALCKLRSEIEQVLLRAPNSNYQSLNRLIQSLTEKHHLLDSPAESAVECLPEHSEILLHTDPWAEIADSLSTERSTASCESAAPVPQALDASGSATMGAVNEPSPETCPDDTPKVACEPSQGIAAVEAPVLQAAGPTGDRHFIAPETVVEATPRPDVAAVESPIPRTIPRDSFSELLRKIDQGQESTKKLVDSFLAGRQAMAAGRPVPNDNGQGRPTLISPGVSSPDSNPAASPPARPAELVAAQPDESLSHVDSAGEQASPVEIPLDGAAQIATAPPKPARHRAALWISASAMLLALTFAIPQVRNRLMSGIGRDVIQKGWMLVGGRTSVQANLDDAVAIAVRDQLKFARRNILLEQAEILHGAGRRQEARTFLCRLLELYPDYSPAKEELDKVTAEINAPSEPGDQTSPVQQLLGSAALAIKAGNLQKAKNDLDAAEQLEPGLQEVAKLRKSLEAKKTELSQSAARDQEAQRAAKQQDDTEALALRAEGYYRQGKYDDALAAIEGNSASNPTSPHLQEIRNRTLEVKLNLQSYEAAVGAGKFIEAQAAVDRIERINPADPGLAALRKRAETAQGSGSALLSVYSLGEPALLTLDERPVGAGGEVMNQTVAAGRHTLAAKSGKGQEVEMVHEFVSGQALTLVYDVTGRILRPMIESDRGRIAKSKARLQAHRFVVEHSHGILRGSCRGDLVIDYYHVVYQPTSGSHGFSAAYKDLRLRIENRTAVFLLAANGTEFFTFKLSDTPSAQMLRKVWDDLAALDM